MRRHGLLAIALTSWTLLYSRYGTTWRPLDEFLSPTTCERVRRAWIEREAAHEIGPVLANQPAENPLRRRALGRALRRVEPRFRCQVR